MLLNLYIAVCRSFPMSQFSTIGSVSTKYASVSANRINDQGQVPESKNCKLCRKRLSTNHFLNPKTGLLFSVCDICRQRKRDKYWSLCILFSFMDRK